MNTLTASHYRQAFDYISGAVDDAGARRQALERFLAHGLPTTREENWKYTRLDHLDSAVLHVPSLAVSPARGTPAGSPLLRSDPSAAPARGTPPDAHPQGAGRGCKADKSATTTLRPPGGLGAAPAVGGYPGPVLAFANGRLASAALQSGTVLADSLARHVGTRAVRQHLGKVAGETALTQLNAALWQDGALLHLPAGSQSEQALFVVHIASEADAMLHLRHLVILEAGASAVLVEHYTGTADTPYWNNSVTEIVLGEGARLTHIVLTEESAAATHTSRVAVQQARDSSYHALSVSLGGRLARRDVWVNLGESGAECQLDGLFIADARRHVDHHLQVEHAAAHTTSRQTWRGIAAGRGRGIYDARVVVQPGAQKSDALQSSRNLLLSPHAEIDVKPQLEIYNDDVKCGHGATVGQLDDAQVFYLRSRGIDADAARALLLRAFAEEALVLLRGTGLRDWLEPHLAAALPVLKMESTA
jgi:Fe-S cluster assembly protein SufD